MKKDFDKELSDLIMSERISKMYATGAITKAISVYRKQAADAEIARQTAERKATRLETIETTVKRYTSKAFEAYIRDVRTAHVRGLAETFKSKQAEREAVIAAIDEVLAIDEADDVLQDVSEALGIALPADDAKAEICRRYEVGNAEIQFNRLIGTLNLSKFEKFEPLSDDATDEERKQAHCKDMRALTVSEFNRDLHGLIRAATNFGRYSEDKFIGAQRYIDTSLKDELATLELRLKQISDLARYIIKRAYPMPDVFNDLDEEALESAKQIVCDPWDAGLTSIGDMLAEHDFEIHSRDVEGWISNGDGRLSHIFEDLYDDLLYSSAENPDDEFKRRIAS